MRTSRSTGGVAGSCAGEPRRHLYQHRGAERHRPPDEALLVDGLIRSASVGTGGDSYSYSNFNSNNNGPQLKVTTTATTTTAVATAQRQLKKTVRFDAHDDELLDDTVAINNQSNGLIRDWASLESAASGTTANRANGTRKNGKGAGGATRRGAGHELEEQVDWMWLGRQDSRESAARDSGVDTLTSGEEVINHIAPYDLKFKVTDRLAKTKKKRRLYQRNLTVAVYSNALFYILKRSKKKKGPQKAFLGSSPETCK